MDIVLGVALPLLVVFIMTVVGLELTPADFTAVRRNPGAVVLVLAGQWILLPVVAVSIARIMALPPTLACGLAIIAAAHR